MKRKLVAGLATAIVSLICFIHLMLTGNIFSGVVGYILLVVSWIFALSEE